LLALLVVTAGCASLSGDRATETTTDAVGTDDDVLSTDTSEPTPDQATPTTDASDTPTDDTTVRASLVGSSVTGLNVSVADTERKDALAQALDVPTRNVRLRTDRGVLEVYDADVSGQALRDALAQRGFDTSDARVRQGVTDATQAETVGALETRLDTLGIDATVESATVDGRRGVAITPADGNLSRVRDAVADRGRVEIVAHFPANGSDGAYHDVTVLTNEDVANVGAVQAGRAAPYVPVTVTSSAAANFSSSLVAFGFTGEGVANCPTDAATADPANASGYCLYTVHDGDVVYAAGMSAGLADAIESGEWEQDPAFVMTAANESAAQELRAHLQAGALPTRLALAERDR
jgi:preprotein translocase subunit SecD